MAGYWANSSVNSTAFHKVSFSYQCKLAGQEQKLFVFTSFMYPTKNIMYQTVALNETDVAY